MITISIYLIITNILLVNFPFVVLRHFLNKEFLTKIGLKEKNSLIIFLNFLITISIFFTTFSIVDFDENSNITSNSIKLTIYFSTYYLLNVFILSYRIYIKHGKINTTYFQKSFSLYRTEIYLFALVINFTIIVYKNAYTQSMYNTFTFLIILDTLIILIFKIIKDYVENEEG